MAGEFLAGLSLGEDVGQGIVNKRRERRFNQAFASGDMQQAALIDPDRFRQQQQIQAQQAEAQAGQDTLRRQATLRAAQAAKNLSARIKDPVAAFDTVARISGKTFSPEDLAEARVLVEQQGDAAFDILASAAADPSQVRPTQPIRPFEIQQDGRTVLATFGPDGSVQVIGEAPPREAGGSADPLTAEYRRAQIDSMRAQTAAREQKLQAETQAAEAKALAKKQFAAGSVANGLRAVDTALAFFGTDRDGDGVISEEERGGGLLNSKGEKGIARTVGAVRRRADALLPGSDIARLKQQIKPLASNIGLDRLVELKSSGATLGAVSNFELQTLQATLANLDQVDDPEQLLRDLNYIRTTFTKIDQNLQEDGLSLDDVVSGGGDARLSDYSDEELEAIAAGLAE
jgi:hypothetical protein